MTDSGFSSARETPPTESSSKKCKNRDALEGLVDVIGKMHEPPTLALNISGPKLVFDASNFILEKVQRLDFFMSLPDVARHVYVFHALEKSAN
ncbi:hypothetical protein SASPL_129895 [Salvia splendens]|uniref:Uncharacterized protein n=1 Tax=Salvia splendens TaxID=180675 RepID=A0A8X8XI26_SALSN|nr:hypothetical protein SASPL_129895 [Salvia splendens]